MKTRSKNRSTLLVSGFFLALLLSAAAHVHAEDRATDRPPVETKEKETGKRKEEPMQADISRDTARLLGPSGEEIHEFLYPVPEDDRVLTRAN